MLIANAMGPGCSEGHPAPSYGWLRLSASRGSGYDTAGAGQMSTNIAKIRLTDDLEMGYIYSVVRQVENTCNLHGQFSFRKGKPRVIGGRKVSDPTTCRIAESDLTGESIDPAC